ncbi:MAG: HEAT repeat domain-containing protein [Nitrospirota bacterium]
MKDFHSISDEQLMGLLFTGEDRLRRTIVDEFIRRKGRMVRPHAEVIRYSHIWTSEPPEWWAAVHCVYILGAIGGAEVVTPLLKALRYAVAHECDWVTEEIPSIFGKVGLPAVEGLKQLAADETTDWYARALAIGGLEGIIIHHTEIGDDVFKFFHSLMTSEKVERETRSAAGNALLDFLRDEYKDDLIAFGKEERRLKDRDPAYIHGFDDADVRYFFEKGEKDLWHYTQDWLSFYDDAKIEERQKRWEQEDLEEKAGMMPDASHISHSEKVGRNDLCPCGSGKKYKKCCGLVH